MFPISWKKSKKVALLQAAWFMRIWNKGTVGATGPATCYLKPRSIKRATQILRLIRSTRNDNLCQWTAAEIHTEQLSSSSRCNCDQPERRRHRRVTSDWKASSLMASWAKTWWRSFVGGVRSNSITLTASALVVTNSIPCTVNTWVSSKHWGMRRARKVPSCLVEDGQQTGNRRWLSQRPYPVYFAGPPPKPSTLQQSSSTAFPSPMCTVISWIIRKQIHCYITPHFNEIILFKDPFPLFVVVFTVARET